MDNLAKPSVTARKFVEARPDRFALAMGGVNLLRPMPSLRELTAVVRDLPVAYAVVGPSFWGDGLYPPSDAVYYPLYTKCAETRAAAVRQHRPARSADPRRGAEPDPPRPGVRALPRAEAVHDPRRRPVVGHRDPADDQVPEPAVDDVGVVAEAAARKPAALHAHPRQEQGDLRLGLAGAADAARGARGAGAGPARRRAGQLSLQQRAGVLLRREQED